MLKFVTAPLWVLSSVTGEWVDTKRDSRLPAELRIANEGLAHGKYIRTINKLKLLV